VSDRTPLRIWVGLTSSAGVTREELTKRGVTLAAFALAVSEKRPVYITPYVVNSSYRGRGADTFLSWDIQTSPIVLSELMGCLSSPEVTRYAGLAATYRINPGCNGQWPSIYNDERKMREVLGANPDDLYLPSIHLYDPLLADPIGWLHTNVAKYTDPDRVEA
jgi:hypothetical protein